MILSLAPTGVEVDWGENQLEKKKIRRNTIMIAKSNLYKAE
jgi:hypothetical protein